MRLAARFGFAVAAAMLVTGVFVATPAVAQDPPPPVAVIPGGPPFVLAGPYSGSGSLSAGDFVCPPSSGAPFRHDVGGSFTHPSLGEGTYEFHLRACLDAETNVATILPGTFVLAGSKQFVSGTLSFKGFFVAGTRFGYSFDLTARGGCKAHFRADGSFGNPPVFDDAGTLTQIGSIICRAT